MFWEGKTTSSQSKRLLSDLSEKQQEIQHELENEFFQSKDMLFDENKSNTILQAIHEKMGNPLPQKPKTRRIYTWAVAASIILICSTATLIGIQNYTTPSSDKMITPDWDLLSAVYHINSQQDTLVHILPDGSIVILSPNSSFSYDTQYGETHRFLALKGEGKFDVQRDPSRPFTVSSNGYTTTALGTEFIVSTRTKGETVVKLISGKVVVRATPTSYMPITDIVLHIGDELLIDDMKQAVNLISKTNKHDQQAPKTIRKELAKEHTEVLESLPLHFDKTALDDVFQQIAARFSIQIDIDAPVLKELSFTGKFSSEDPVEIILNTICNMNDLTYEKTSDDHIRIQYKIVETTDTTENIKSHYH